MTEAKLSSSAVFVGCGGIAVSVENLCGLLVVCASDLCDGSIADVPLTTGSRSLAFVCLCFETLEDGEVCVVG